MALNAIPTPDLADKAYWPYHQIMVPCYHVSGWYDLHTWAVFKNFLNMREQGGSQLAREGQHVFIGPWIHGHRISHIVGDLNFGPSANPQGARATEYQLAFFNKYLRAMNVELPAIRYFVMGRNRWRDAETWPLPETQWQRCFLHSKGRANTSEGDGTLSWDNPGSEPTDTFVYDPHLSVPTTGGRILPQAGLVPGPRDQSHIEKRNDVLCYATHELQNDIEVTGPLKVRLFASTSVKDTDFTAKLVDVHPDSHAYNVAEGIIRARYRKSIYRPELVSPGEIIEYTIDMANLSHVFRRGHYIRLDISSSNFPAFDRNMNTGNPMGEDIKGIPATQTIFHQSEYPSYIDLPVIPPSR
jgi:putative CocE/NonD family hydrolase